MALNRRDFLKGSALATLAIGAGAHTRIGLGSPRAATDEVLVFVYLRGGIDGLSLVTPVGGELRNHYEQARSATRIPATGANAALPLANSGGLWGLHPRASALHELYHDGLMAVVHAVGMIHEPVSRSHFDAQAYMEFGVNGQTAAEGWLSRHLVSGGLPASVPIPAVSAGAITATSLLGSSEAITMANGNNFRLNQGPWQWNNIDRGPASAPDFRGFVEMLPQLWQGNTALERKGRQALDSLALIRPIDFNAYTPGNGAVYPGHSLGDQVKMLANLIKRSELGLRIATIDYGGWDTHNGQGNPSNSYDYFGNQVEPFARAMNALFTDLGQEHGNRVSVVVLSEFGRRVLENDAGGTDHGYGNVALVMGGAVNGGQTYGHFPGLGIDQMFERADVGVSTDYRQILSECLLRRLGNPYLGHVFPGMTDYAPLGLFQDGTGLAPNWSGFDKLFADGFED
ncbi:MAG: DUF1501 domain-containing protein [Xanthomonadales bacterium]|nr:DUF1501 domain-containing protein [Xanthomonadales bacterium]